MRSLFLVGLGLAVIGTGCNQPAKETASKPDVLAVNMDSTVQPGDDIFLYANGGWIKKNPIPGAESGWGIGNMVIDENLHRLRAISEQAAKEKADKGTATQQIGDFWKTAMDSARIEADGIKPLQPYLDKVNAITNTAGLLDVLADFDPIGVNGILDFGVSQDEKKSDVYALHMWQTGIGLPEREYYFKNDSSTANIRKAYVSHVARILGYLGTDSLAAATQAQQILETETQIAKVHRKLEDLRDPYANYNKMALKSLETLAPGIDWNKYETKLGINGVDSVIVGQPEYYKTIGGILTKTPIETWKAMLRYRLASRFAETLPDKFGKASFEFSRFFSGAKERKPRWKRTISAEERAIGEQLGKLYVTEFFTPAAKKRYEDLVESVRNAYAERIKNLSWMSDSTKQKALVKLAAVKKKVGYPEKWKDFSKMDIGTASYLENSAAASRWWSDYYMKKLGKPVDRNDWDMTPQTYNAYYNASNNEIVLPAGIFTVPGYKDEELDDATVYGYAGASTIGHEITHGFDDEGRQYDAEGNLKSWWTKADEDAFIKRANVMVEQFNRFEPLPGSHINGKATLGENIADLGGILIALDAFKKTEQYKKNDTIAGLTPTQRFFLGYALGWMSHQREQQLKNRLMTDVHSPAQYRVIGPFVSVPEFYEAFHIKPTDKMYLSDSLRVNIW